LHNLGQEGKKTAQVGPFIFRVIMMTEFDSPYDFQRLWVLATCLLRLGCAAPAHMRRWGHSQRNLVLAMRFMSDMYVFVAPGLPIDEVSHPCSASILLALLDVLLLAGLARRALARVGDCAARRETPSRLPTHQPIAPPAPRSRSQTEQRAVAV